ncbi:hypothetical protein OS493_039620 [Desmophyllum pertusum]|uniref:Kinesin light chain n=1 Tax=Desmophyllum pertusum TaxID=174260 RepID=A0A9X0CJ83_9CNID|nr:hypothetical protein OS493_039620 [Desmophyllum pertusum]
MAVEAFQKASNMRSNVLGDHKDTAQSYHWLGKAQHNKRDLDGALESLQKASQMREEVLGWNHPSTTEKLEASRACPL